MKKTVEAMEKLSDTIKEIIDSPEGMSVECQDYTKNKLKEIRSILETGENILLDSNRSDEDVRTEFKKLAEEISNKTTKG